MKVLEILDCFYPNLDGPIEVAVSIARKYSALGLGEMHLLVPDYPKRVEVEGVKIFRCRSAKSDEDYRAALPMFDGKIRKLIKKGGYDVIHLHSPFTLGRYALKCGRKYHIPVVFTMHTKFRDEFEKRLKNKLLVKFMMSYIMKCINGCDVVTSVSRGTVNTLAEYGYKDIDSVKVVPNATNMRPKSADTEVTARIRKELGLEGTFAFSYIGRLAATKNIDFSLRVLSKVKQRGGKFKFVLVGGGEYEKTLRSLVKKLGIEEEVVFAGAVSDKNLLASYYSAFDLLLFPSVFDNASMVILEAAANGLPTATIKDSCSAERITDGESGFVWDNDEEVWAQEILKLLSEPERVRRAADGALSSVYVGWDDIVKEYSDIYKNTL
ncbi:MAG: glycosyltransferase [Clostridia bacterium]|nr:glycosyltransferase [Clostridia bacterium]